MGKNPSFSGNIELLKSIGEVQKSTYTLNAGNNIELDYDANTQTNTINVLATPNFDDLVVNNVNILNELNKKYSVVNDVNFADNEINLNLGSINGIQTPKLEHQAVNKKYVDEQLDYFWEQILKMNFVNLKGRYNDRLTYSNGDLVAFFENNNWYFYLSIIDLNNEKLTNANAWIKISTPVPSNLITEDRLNLELQQFEEKINNRNLNYVVIKVVSKPLAKQIDFIPVYMMIDGEKVSLLHGSSFIGRNWKINIYDQNDPNNRNSEYGVNDWNVTGPNGYTINTPETNNMIWGINYYVRFKNPKTNIFYYGILNYVNFGLLFWNDKVVYMKILITEGGEI